MQQLLIQLALFLYELYLSIVHKTLAMKYSVYVVELDKKVWTDRKKFRDANPQFRGVKECLYVGMTSHSPRERFLKHKQGYRSKKGYKISSSYVEKYGKFLRPSLYNEYKPHSKKEAMQMEQELAQELKKKGYAVWWN